MKIRYIYWGKRGGLMVSNHLAGAPESTRTTLPAERSRPHGYQDTHPPDSTRDMDLTVKAQKCSKLVEIDDGPLSQ